MSSADRVPIARWLYEGGSVRLVRGAAGMWRNGASTPRFALRWVGISSQAAGVAFGAYALWPRPLEEQLRLPSDAMRQCIEGIAEVPTEYAARKLYKKCRVAAREQLDLRLRLPAWEAYNRQMRECESCFPDPASGRTCPPKPQKPPAQGW